MPEVDQHFEVQASPNKPEPSKEVMQEEVDQEKEVEEKDAGEESVKSIAGEDVLVNEEKFSEEEKELSEERPEGQGQNSEKTTTDAPVEQENLKDDNSQPDGGKTDDEGAPGGDQLATTEKDTAGDESPTIGVILKKKRTTRRKAAPQATAVLPVGTDPEPIVSAPVEEEKDGEGVSNVVGPKKKKQKVQTTAVRRSNRQRA
ncbi:hypothetical protein P8452_56818 [Trifolium repens]|nr:hypothetical protein P8452_56818 [Trifolium repens]